MTPYTVLTDFFPCKDAYKLRLIVGDCIQHIGEILDLANVSRNIAVIMFGDVEKPNICLRHLNGKPTHLITLNAYLEESPEFIFQFSHEWTHHILGEKLPESYAGLMWMEEILCRLVSLETMEHFNHDPFYQDLSLPQMQDFLDNPSAQTAECIRSLGNRIPPDWFDELNDQTKSSARLTAISLRLIEIFLCQKKLFQIFAKAGRPVDYGSLEDYFLCLQSFADQHSSDSLMKVKNYFRIP